MTERKFIDTSLSSEILKNLNDYRKSENHEFCDWLLKTSDGQEFHVHKNVVASACPYFKGLFNTNLKECRSGSIILSNISGYDLHRILDYLYSGEFVIDMDNIKETFEIASYLLLKNLQNFIADHLEKSINDTTCLDFWNFSEKNLCEKLSDKCVKYILTNADRLFNISFVENLNISQIIYLLQENSLNCSEEKICETIISWIRNDFKHREEHVEKLFNEIRLPLLCEQFMISHIFNSDLLGISPTFSSKVIETCKIKMQLNTNQFLINKSIIPRYGNRKESIFVIRGSHFEIFSNDQFYGKPSLEYQYKCSAHTVFDENLLLVCGIGQSGNLCTYYCPIQNKWKRFPSMQKSRKNHGAVFLRNKIYVCGGNDGETTEFFDLLKEKWLWGVPSSRSQFNFGICTMDDCVYIVGGCNKSIESLDIREGKWNVIATECSEFSKACVFDDNLYCIHKSGGNIFDLRKNKWNTSLPSLSSSSESMYKFDICAKNRQIYGYGYVYPASYSNYNRGEYQRIICCYQDEVQNNWKRLYTSNTSNYSNTPDTDVAIALLHA